MMFDPRIIVDPMPILPPWVLFALEKIAMRLAKEKKGEKKESETE